MISQRGLGLNPHYFRERFWVKRYEIMNYEAVEETIKAGYREVSSQYRTDDEIEVTTANHIGFARPCSAFALRSRTRSRRAMWAAERAGIFIA